MDTVINVIALLANICGCFNFRFLENMFLKK